MTHVTTFWNNPISRNGVICAEYGFNVSYLITLWLKTFRAVTQSDSKSLSYTTKFFKSSRVHELPAARGGSAHRSDCSDASSPAAAQKLKQLLGFRPPQNQPHTGNVLFQRIGGRSGFVVRCPRFVCHVVVAAVRDTRGGCESVAADLSFLRSDKRQDLWNSVTSCQISPRSQTRNGYELFILPAGRTDGEKNQSI